MARPSGVIGVRRDREAGKSVQWTDLSGERRSERAARREAGPARGTTNSKSQALQLRTGKARRRRGIAARRPKCPPLAECGNPFGSRECPAALPRHGDFGPPWAPTSITVTTYGQCQALTSYAPRVRGRACSGAVHRTVLSAPEPGADRCANVLRPYDRPASMALPQRIPKAACAVSRFVTPRSSARRPAPRFRRSGTPPLETGRREDRAGFGKR